MGVKKLIVTVPEELTGLQEEVVQLYDSTTKFQKSRTILKMLEAALVLRKHGLLDYVVGLGSAQEVLGSEDSKSALVSLLTGQSVEKPSMRKATELQEGGFKQDDNNDEGMSKPGAEGVVGRSGEPEKSSPSIGSCSTSDEHQGVVDLPHVASSQSSHGRDEEVVSSVDKSPFNRTNSVGSMMQLGVPEKVT